MTRARILALVGLVALTACGSSLPPAEEDQRAPGPYVTGTAGMGMIYNGGTGQVTPHTYTNLQFGFVVL